MNLTLAMEWLLKQLIIQILLQAQIITKNNILLETKISMVVY